MPAHDDRHPELPLDPDVDDRLPVHLRPGALLVVALGGVAGTWLRYELAVRVPGPANQWPWGTFAANGIGCLVLGFLVERLARSGADTGWRRRARLLGGTGFCGGLTTYSTLAVETDLLVRAHDAGLAFGYLAGTLAMGTILTVLGIALAAAHHRRTVLA